MSVASFLTYLHFLMISPPEMEILLPVRCSDRSEPINITLTNIGEFGLLRKARPNIKAHLHTGIDIRRPSNNYVNEPIYSISEGLVLSKRDDGPYAQLIIEHEVNGLIFWTVYEHIAGITVGVGEKVDSEEPIAHFMNKNELDKYGWQFDHFHFEILKKFPQKNKPTSRHPQRFFQSYTLECFSKVNLDEYFYDPINFLEQYL